MTDSHSISSRKSASVAVTLSTIALFFIEAAATTAHARPPSGPRLVSPGEGQYFRSLVIPPGRPAPPRKQQTLSDYLTAETDGQLLEAVGSAYNLAQKSCCGKGDCRKVQAEDNGNDTYTAFLGEAFPNSRTRTVIVPKEKMVQEQYVSRFTPTSSVLCASPTETDLANTPDTIYCFDYAGILSMNNSRQWMAFIRQQEIVAMLPAPKP